MAFSGNFFLMNVIPVQFFDQYWQLSRTSRLTLKNKKFFKKNPLRTLYIIRYKI